MRIKPRRVEKDLTLMVDPNPNWTALVDHGANQTPWNALKAEAGIDQQENEMSKAGKGAKKNHKVLKLTFSKAQYKTEKSVKGYLEEHEFEDYEIEDGDDVWVVKSTEDTTALKLGKPRSVATKSDGVYMHVAEVLKTDPKDEEDESEEEGDEDGEEETVQAGKKKAATKAKVIDGKETKATKSDGPEDEAEEVNTDTVLRFHPVHEKKYDFWASYMSNEGSLLGVIKDGIDYDGVPPGVDEVMSASYYTIGNILDGETENKEAALKQLGEDMAGLVYGLYELFTKATVDAAKGNEAAKKFVETFQASITKSQEGALVLTAPTPENKTKADDDNVSNEPEAEEETEIEKSLAKVVGKLVTPTLEAIGKQVTKAQATADAAKKAAEKTQKLVDEDNSRSTTRKSLADAADDFGDIGDEEDDDETKEEMAQRSDMVRRAMGLGFGAVQPRSN